MCEIDQWQTHLFLVSAHCRSPTKRLPALTSLRITKVRVLSSLKSQFDNDISLAFIYDGCTRGGWLHTDRLYIFYKAIKSARSTVSAETFSTANQERLPLDLG